MYRYLFVAALALCGGYVWGLSDGLTMADSVLLSPDQLAFGK